MTRRLSPCARIAAMTFELAAASRSGGEPVTWPSALSTASVPATAPSCPASSAWVTICRPTLPVAHHAVGGQPPDGGGELLRRQPRPPSGRSARSCGRSGGRGPSAGSAARRLPGGSTRHRVRGRRPGRSRPRRSPPWPGARGVPGALAVPAGAGSRSARLAPVPGRGLTCRDAGRLKLVSWDL